MLGSGVAAGEGGCVRHDIWRQEVDGSWVPGRESPAPGAGRLLAGG